MPQHIILNQSVDAARNRALVALKGRKSLVRGAARGIMPGLDPSPVFLDYFKHKAIRISNKEAVRVPLPLGNKRNIVELEVRIYGIKMINQEVNGKLRRRTVGE